MEQQRIQVRGFNHIFPKLQREIITECGVSMPFKPNSSAAQPPIIKTKGLWDTGATASVITKDLAAQLGLKPVSSAQSHHAGGSSIVNVYLINIYLPNSVALSFVQVSECVETIGRFGLLIGMDVMSLGDFAISHFQGQTSMSFRFPSVKHINLGIDGFPPGVSLSNENGDPEVPAPPVTGPATSRNAPCPCGSGKKYKNCHGKAA